MSRRPSWSAPEIEAMKPAGPICFYNLKYLGERSINNPKSEVAALNCLTDICNSYVLHPDDSISINNVNSIPNQ